MQDCYFNHLTCEYCFNEIKAFLCHHQMLAINETKIAIALAMLNITANSSYAYSSTVDTFYEQHFFHLFVNQIRLKTQLRKMLHDNNRQQSIPDSRSSYKKRPLISRSAAFLWSEIFCIASACSSDPCRNNAFREHVM